MTTKVTIENHGPQKVGIMHNSTLYVLAPTEKRDFHIWKNEGLTVGEIQPVEDKS